MPLGRLVTSSLGRLILGISLKSLKNRHSAGDREVGDRQLLELRRKRLVKLCLAVQWKVRGIQSTEGLA